MKLLAGKEEEFAFWKAKNQKDAYSRACFRFAEEWAEAMESALEEPGSVLADLAKRCSEDVDRRPGFGITGFMYGVAVSILSSCWVHGEELRRWHNLSTQMGTEGEKANEKPGAVLNPALVTVG